MSKTYTSTILTRTARPRSKNLFGAASAQQSASVPQQSTIPLYDDAFWRYFGLDEDGNLYVKKSEAGTPRNLWTYGNLVAGGALAEEEGSGGAMYNLSDVLKAGSLDAVAQIDGTTPAADGQVLAYSATRGKWYAKTVQAGASDVSWSQIYGSTGVKIAEITIDGVATSVYAPTAGSAAGTVTSVAAQGSNGLTVSGGPITSSGTLTIGVDNLHKLPTLTEWNGKQNVLTPGTDYVVPSALSSYALKSSLASVATSGSYSDLSNKPTTLKNPYSLSFGSKTYDGSSAKTVTAEDLGAAPLADLADIALTGSYVDIIDAPTSMKNPYSLSFGNKTYDGSSAKTITAADLGAYHTGNANRSDTDWTCANLNCAGHIYGNRWYPADSQTVYIEFVNNAFRIHGTLVADGNIIAGS